jgi:pyruvate dehydrogenase E1 component
VVAASDYLKILPDALARWIGKPMVALGTDGFGRSEDRAGLRNFFEVDARYVTIATLSALARQGDLDPKVVAKAIKDLRIDPEKKNPRLS